METKLETKRLNAIRLKFVRFEKKCACCGNFFRFEKMWHVRRSGVNRTIHDWYYCQNCMRTPKDVLHAIDTDSYPFGIANIDNDRNFSKTKTKPAYTPPATKRKK